MLQAILVRTRLTAFLTGALGYNDPTLMLDDPYWGGERLEPKYKGGIVLMNRTLTSDGRMSARVGPWRSSCSTWTIAPLGSAEGVRRTRVRSLWHQPRPGSAVDGTSDRTPTI